MKPAKMVIDRKRRSFLKLSALLGLGAVSTALLPAGEAESFLFSKKEYKVSRTRLAMGTFVAMTAIHPSRDEAEEAIGLAFAEIDRLSNMLTHYDSNSPVGSLNGVGRLAGGPQELHDVVARSLYYHHQTSGAFDITVKPLVDLYKVKFSRNENPTDGDIETVLQRVGSENLHFSNGSLHFGRNEMGITLDGIGKGYIVDKASELLVAKGVSNHLINAGGDIRTSGSAAKGKAWTVAVQDPSKSKEYPDIITLRDGAVATSGNYEIYYDNEKIFHHIVDGRTGRSPQLSTSVTVVAPTVMDADALSTSVFVMEPDAGLQFINSRPHCECLVISAAGRISRSEGWQA